MSRMQRDKGKRGEREFAKEMARLFRCEARRGRQYQGSDDSPDVVVDIPGWHFEVKRTERLQLHAAMEQAVQDAGDQIPIVSSRANHHDWLVTIRLEDWPRVCEIGFHQLAATI